MRCAPRRYEVYDIFYERRYTIFHGEQKGGENEGVARNGSAEGSDLRELGSGKCA
jgi:hypothetical protein